jgi:hypothetical protein
VIEDKRIMTEQEMLNASQTHSNPDGIAEASTGSKKEGEKKDFLDVTALIRSIQRAEGNPDCFGKAIDKCDRLNCAWRDYCLEENQPNDTEGIKRGKDRDPEQSV